MGAQSRVGQRISGRLAWVVVCLAALASNAPAQQGPPAEITSIESFVPLFNRWVGEGERADIPWRVEVTDPQLNFDQRLESFVQVDLRGGHLNRSGHRHDLLLMMRVADEAGNWYGGYGYYRHPTEGEMPGRLTLQFTMRVLFRPGTYRVGVLLYDMDTKLRSVTRRTVHVRPLRNDPLPEAWRNLPLVDFGRSSMDTERYVRGARAERMWLPVASARPLHVEVVVNLSSGGAMVLSLLNLVSQFALQHGTMNVTAVDPVRRRTVFQQNAVEQVDWPRFRESLEGMNPHTIDFAALRDRKSNPIFFRDVLGERMARACAAPPAGDNGRPPQRILILLNGGMMFESGSDLTPVTPPQGCAARVYHLLPGGARGDWDEVSKLIAPLDPQTVRVESPAKFREELARLLKEIGS